jgi:hypothetical protein
VGDVPTATCQSAGTAGSACHGDGDCAVGLGCVTPVRDGPGTCGTVTFGDTCNDSKSVRCLVGVPSLPLPDEPFGTCDPEAGAAACPTVIPDGQPCGAPSSTCDTFASCIDALCVLGPPACP